MPRVQLRPGMLHRSAVPRVARHLHELRFDPIRADGRNADAAAAQLEAQGAGVRQHERLRGRIEVQPRKRLERRAGGNLDDARPAVHVGEHGLRDIGQRAAVQVNHGIRFILRDVAVCAEFAESGRVHQQAHLDDGLLHAAEQFAQDTG